MLNMMQCSIRTEVDNIFELINGEINFSSVTTSAFSQARMKYSEQAFVELNKDCILDPFYAQEETKRWRGFRLLSTDGTLATLPPSDSLFEEFGKQCPQARLPCARISQLYDTQNKLSLDVQITPFSVGERELAYQHLSSVKPRDLILYDRGYQCHWLFSAIFKTGADFCARVTHDFNNEVKEFVESKRNSGIIEIRCANDKDELYSSKNIRKESIKVRLVRVQLPSGEIEILATSLCNKERYPHRLFKKLYHLRWGVEEDYKRLKCGLEIENFTGLSPLAIKQDIHAQVVSKNMASLWQQAAQPYADKKSKSCKHNYKVNFSYVLGKFKNNFIKLLLGLIDVDWMMKLLKLIASSTDAERPGRSNERRPKKNSKWVHAMSYKQAF
jgi:hypothetical protein